MIEIKPTKVPYPLITKAIDSTVDNWKSQVYVCHNENELVEAYSKLKGERILLQQYIEKENETGLYAHRWIVCGDRIFRR